MVMEQMTERLLANIQAKMGAKIEKAVQEDIKINQVKADTSHKEMAEIRAGREEMDRKESHPNRNESHVRQGEGSQLECLAGREDGLPRNDGGR
jgi:hypothetical protein